MPADGPADWTGRSTRAVVDLDAIAHNVRGIRRLIGNAELITVVKADGYGHGAVPIARTALANGASRLAVYTAGEGAALRRSGISAPILVFGPYGNDEARTIWEHSLTPTVTSLAAAELLQREAAGRRLPFHLEVDTGLTRAGALPEEALPLMRSVERLQCLYAEGIYTHFARADERDESSSEAQLELFLLTIDQLSEAGFRFSIRHAANSAATLALPPSRLNAVRAGISTYGCYPSDEVPRAVALRPALSLVSGVARLTRIPIGAGVGYGHEFRATRESLIALVPIGYGDGLPRQLGLGQGRVLVRGKLVPIVGRVSMDQITVDVTEVADVSVGDEVTVIGRQGAAEQSAADVGKQAGTISYDILTGLLPRVPRLYTSAGSVVDTTGSM